MWLLGSAVSIALALTLSVATGVQGSEGEVELLTAEEMSQLRGQGICAKCQAVAGTACPAVGNPCATIRCTLHRWRAGDGISWCTGSNYTCTVAGMRKGCEAAWEFWCNANSAGAPCGNKRTGTCFLGIGGCWCRAAAGGACPQKNCT